MFKLIRTKRKKDEDAEVWEIREKALLAIESLSPDDLRQMASLALNKIVNDG